MGVSRKLLDRREGKGCLTYGSDFFAPSPCILQSPFVEGGSYMMLSIFERTLILYCCILFKNQKET